ncbi:MAG: cytochrome c oxidase assembly protein [Novosphingobium sp.]|nr:cytochrome c oxidase assembly protein [Novosphingobium sp.]
MATAISGNNRNRRVAMMLATFAAAMLGLGFASVPLYRLFCQATGFAGTPQRVSEARAREVDATGDAMSIRFDANVARGLPWSFRPEQTTQEITLGGRKMAIFLARNDSDKPITGRASYNIEPEQVAKYFNKVQCFCFTEQTLQPHQEVRMPVIYYVDPKIKDDPDAKGVDQITLSYTFHVLSGQAAKGLDPAPTGG